jgi:hypothetical protein
MRSYNSGNSGNSGTTKRNTTSATATPFCKVCCDAGLPADKYKSHYVKDQPGPNGKVVCPTLLSQKCLICGVPGHTTRYCPNCPDCPDCPNNPDNSSTTYSDHRPRYATATDEVRSSLPTIQQIQQRALIQRPAPHIVYEKKTEFPALHTRFNLDTRFHNDEPLQKRGPAEFEASPIHSPVEQKLTKVKYNKRNNPFGALRNYQVKSEDEEPKQQKKSQQLPPITATPITATAAAYSSSSWASIAALKTTAITTITKNTTNTTTTSIKQQQQQRCRSRFSIVVPTAISAPLLPQLPQLPQLPPIVFKAKLAAPADSKQVKKLWGDTDSEDDEVFLKRGLE